MEFIKVGKNYLIKNSNGRIVSEKEKMELENKELIIKDFESNECQGKTTRKLAKNRKRLEKFNKELINNGIKNQIIGTKIYVNGLEVPKDTKEYKVTALNNEVQNDTIEEANKSI